MALPLRPRPLPKNKIRANAYQQDAVWNGNRQGGGIICPAACTTGGTLPGMKLLPPFQVIYQTAEDGLGDTINPRLMEAEADQSQDTEQTA